VEKKYSKDLFKSLCAILLLGNAHGWCTQGNKTTTKAPVGLVLVRRHCRIELLAGNAPLEGRIGHGAAGIPGCRRKRGGVALGVYGSSSEWRMAIRLVPMGNRFTKCGTRVAVASLLGKLRSKTVSDGTWANWSINRTEGGKEWNSGPGGGGGVSLLSDSGRQDEGKTIGRGAGRGSLT